MKVIKEIIVLGLLTVSSVPALADSGQSVIDIQDEGIYKDKARLNMSLGAYDVVRRVKDSAESVLVYGLEYQDKIRYPLNIKGMDLGIRGIVGVLDTEQGDWFAYAGLMGQVPLWKKGYVNVSFAPGYYSYGGKDVDLDNDLEFKSGVELGYEFSNHMRLGLGFSHMSNASLGKRNPGVELLQLNYSLPLAQIF